MSHSIAAALVAFSALAATADAGAAGSCPVVDVMPEFQSVLARTAASPMDRQLQEQKSFVAAHSPLYAADVLGITHPGDLDGMIKEHLPDIRARDKDIDAAAAALHAKLPGYLDDFRAAFPDFDCNFTIYMMPSFGAFDGAGRRVAGQPAMVLGVDTIAAYEKPEQLKVFIDHEIFHRYHYQSAGFSDDDGDAAPIWVALWAEGLATYVSATMNPQRPLADALLLPRDLEERAQPRVADIARALRANLDRRDPAFFGQYFEYGSTSAEAAGLPSRSGYYLGYRVAGRLAKEATLPELAHLRGDALRARIAAALDELSSEKKKPDTR